MSTLNPTLPLPLSPPTRTASTAPRTSNGAPLPLIELGHRLLRAYAEAARWSAYK